jgi:hypothetical protein
MDQPNNEIDVDKFCEEMAEAIPRAEAARKARQLAQEIAANRQAINCDYIIRMEINGENPTLISLFMNTGKVWRIEKRIRYEDNPSVPAISLYELYDELINKGDGLVKIPCGFRLTGN